MWRQRRGRSQHQLALRAEISARHLSFVETGRSLPSRPMLVRLAEHLDVPLRDRNTLMLAAGYAPLYPERALDSPALAAARRAIDLVLTGHEPYPALAIDRHWNLIARNRVVDALLAGVAAKLLAPAPNVLRLAMHPAGLAPRIENLSQWRRHALARVARQIELTGDSALEALLAELRQYADGPAASVESDEGAHIHPDIAIPFRLRTEWGVLSFISTRAVFGTAVDITLSELAIEAFFPADPDTAKALAKAMATRRSPAARPLHRR